MKSKTSLALFVVLHSDDDLLLLQDSDSKLPHIDLIDCDGNFMCTPEDGIQHIVKKFFRLDYDYVISQISQTFVDYKDGAVTIYHKIVLIKSNNFFNNTVNYTSLKDKLQNDNDYTQLCQKFRLF